MADKLTCTTRGLSLAAKVANLGKSPVSPTKSICDIPPQVSHVPEGEKVRNCPIPCGSEKEI